MSSPDKDVFFELLLWRRGRARPVHVYREPADLWIGYYRGDTHHYVCPLPTVVIRWGRRVNPSEQGRT